MSDKPEIVVTGRFDFDARHLDAVRQAMLIMQAASRAEDGCQDYTFSVELADTAVVRLSERWDDFDALTRHFATPHMAAYRQAMAVNPANSRLVSFYEVAEIEPPSV